MNRYALFLLTAIGLSGCYGIPQCAGPLCYTESADTDLPDRPVDTDTKPTEPLDCVAAQADAVALCVSQGTMFGGFTCDADGHSYAFTCLQDTDGDGNGDVIDVTVNVTVEGDDINIDVEQNQSTEQPDTEEPTDTDEEPEPRVPQCRDGLDNDLDGHVDYPADPGCSDRDDDNEINVAGCTRLNDFDYCGGNSRGVDDDCNGIVDDGDWDGDGFVSGDCDLYTGLRGGDCNDSGNFSGYLHSAFIFPGAIELGDWIRSDCNNAPTDWDHGCAVQCQADPNPADEEFEWDGDTAMECVSAYFTADLSNRTTGDANPLDGTLTWSFEPPGAVSPMTYTDIAVTCEATPAVQGNPAMWAPMVQVRDAMVNRALQQPGVSNTRVELEALLPVQ